MSGARQPARRAVSLVVLLVAMLAFTWQSFVTQTHVHDPARVAVAAPATGVAVARASGGQPSDLPANCLLCTELAHVGAYVASAPVVLDPPAETTFWAAQAREQRLSLLRRSQGWRSRAPPTLHA